ncbi:MAG: GldG family protein [Desulfobacterales bacterium]|nr:GldG family protein [Desulfobacterales bacterium]
MSDSKKGFGKSLFSAAGLGLVLLILIFVNIIFSQFSPRWDATADRMYSLSDSTIDILSSLKEDVTIKVFYSQDAENTPNYLKTYARRVLEFISEYEHHGKGAIHVEIYNPKVDSEEEEWAQKYGVRGMGLPTGDSFYFGLVILAADQEETMPYLDMARENQLEYDITRIISKVQTSKKRKISIFSGLPVLGTPAYMRMPGQPGGQEPWLFVTELKKTYDIKEIKASDDRIDEDTDLLMVMYPKGISNELQYAIDQYVLSGGNALIMVDPMAVTDSAPAQNQMQAKSASLDKLFAAWGVRMDSSKILADMDYPTRLAGRDNQVEDNPMWISLEPAGFNQENILTAKLEKMLLPMAGVIEKTDDLKVKMEPLLQSSANASLVNGFMARFGADAMRRDFKAAGENYNLAVKLSGAFKTAYPAGKPKKKAAEGETAEEDVADSKPHLTAGEKEATIIILADSDLLFDRFYVNIQNFLGMNLSQIFNDNLNFLLNSAEILSGVSSLIDIRSRGQFERPFTVVQDLEKKAQARWLAREQELVKKADDTNQKLRELEKNKDSSQQFIISEEQEKEIAKFKEEKIRVSKELKIVRRNLRSEIESLGHTLKFVNIALIPLLVSIGGILYSIHRRKKRMRGQAV